jgi:hypothetical protein
VVLVAGPLPYLVDVSAFEVSVKADLVHFLLHLTFSVALGVFFRFLLLLFGLHRFKVLFSVVPQPNHGLDLGVSRRQEFEGALVQDVVRVTWVPNFVIVKGDRLVSLDLLFLESFLLPLFEVFFVPSPEFTAALGLGMCNV